MWQRIQTLYLFLAIAVNIFALTLNVGSLNFEGLTHQFSFYGLVNAGTGEMIYSATTLLIICVVSILLSLVVIFMYKKRQLQIKLSQLNLFVQLTLLVAIFFMMDDAAGSLNLDTKVSLEYGPGTFLTIVPLVFIYLAIRAIKKDEALVRAADRIR